MKLNFWNTQKRDDDTHRGGGLRRQTQVRRNLDQPAEEEPETIERAVRRDDVEDVAQRPTTKRPAEPEAD
jgi:hypothetical protein